MGLEDDFLLADADDEKTIEFIKNYLPQDLKEKFLEEVVAYIVKEAKKDEMGEYDPEEVLFVVQGEMEYGDSLGQAD